MIYRYYKCTLLTLGGGSSYQRFNSGWNPKMPSAYGRTSSMNSIVLDHDVKGDTGYVCYFVVDSFLRSWFLTPKAFV